MLGKIESWQQQLVQSLASVIVYTIIAVVTYLSTWLANRRPRPYSAGRSHRQLHVEVQDDIDINVILDRALQILPGSLRCFLSRLHNGDSDIAMQKKTRTHERTAPGVRYQGQEFRAIPISRVPEEMALVVDDGVTWKPVGEIPESTFKQLCHDGGSGNGAVARVAVVVGKRIVGFIGADFARVERPANLDEELRTCARDVSRILSRYH